MSSPFIPRFLPSLNPSGAAIPPVPESPMTPQAMAAQNPFMIAQDRDSPGFKSHYGVNRPFKQPMFLGYRDDKALYGGTKLFILC